MLECDGNDCRKSESLGIYMSLHIRTSSIYVAKEKWLRMIVLGKKFKFYNIMDASPRLA